MSVYEIVSGVDDSVLRKTEETKEALRDDSADAKDYQSRVERMEQRNAERDKSEEIHFGSRASGEALEKYERLEKQRKQQEQKVKDAEKEFKRTVKKAAGTPQGNDYWVNRRKQEYESSVRDLEKIKKQMSDI